ncbi:MAG: choice-of-anchor L domain-containing protein [Flavobacteriales bacterium]|nr:choice-of-anchor L domain-containing protein [Flavobacteriales bacterium]
MTLRFLFVPIAMVATIALKAQLVVDQSLTPIQVVQNLLVGNGVVATNITLNGVLGNTINEQIGGFDGSNSNIGLNNGVLLSSGSIAVAVGPNISGSNTVGGGNFGASDPDLDLLSGVATNDKCVLEFDFIPTGDSVKFNYVFGSEEYNEYVCGTVNDVFGFFISGPGLTGPYSNNSTNIALIPGGSIPVSINTVNNGTVGQNGMLANCDNLDPNWENNNIYFTDNGGGTTVEFDGFTVILTARAQVQCGQIYHIKIAIADGGDTAFDSGVFLEGGSFTSTGSVIPELQTAGTVSSNDSTFFEGCGQIPFAFHRIGDTSVVDTISMVVAGTATGGVDYVAAFPVQLVFPAGDTLIPWPVDVPLDADGLETITITITQNLVCSGTQVINDYTFYIDQYEPLNVVTNDVVGDCLGTYVLAPIITGGTVEKEILWSTGATTNTITVTPPVTTTYYFTVSDTCGVLPWSDSVVVTMPVYPPLALSVSPETMIQCLGNDDIGVTSIAGGNGTYSYAWTLDGANSGVSASINVPAAFPSVYYSVTVTDGCDSTITDSVLVGTIPLDPIVINAPDRTPICQGDTLTLEVLDVTGGTGQYTYVWTNSQQQILGQADTLQVAVPADAGYTITVADQCGNSGDTLVYALIPHPDPFLLSFNADTVICAGDTVALWARVTGGSGYYTIEWPGSELSDPQLLVNPPVNDMYSVNIYDQCGEVISDEVNIGVEAPVAVINSTNAGQDDWVFEAATLPTFCRSYRWDLGDSTMSRERTLAHSYLDLEEHWVHLKVITYVGCSAVDSVLIRPPGQLWFPNAFTPDGDGINETFGPATRYVEKFEMSIFDRWGQPIYSTDAIDKPWDGTVNGGLATTGVYVYKYKAEGHLFPSIENYGHVTLLRGTEGE